MEEVQIITELIRLGWAGVFLWLYLNERKRSAELSDSRIEVLQKCVDVLTEHYDRKH